MSRLDWKASGVIVEAAIELTVPDNTAYTVLVALRRLGYPELARVERADLIRLDLVDAADAGDAIAALMRAEVVFNPNKHGMSYIEPRTVGASPTATLAWASPAATSQSEEWEAVVAERDDVTDDLVNLLAMHFGLRDLQRLERAVAWRLYEANRPAAKERLEWACRELLCNPHSQLADIRPRPLRKAVGEQTPAAANPSSR